MSPYSPYLIFVMGLFVGVCLGVLVVGLLQSTSSRRKSYTPEQRAMRIIDHEG